MQKRGEELAALSPVVWRELPLTAELHDALREALAVKSRETLRRQMQYIGRLMRELDAGEQRALLDALDALKEAARQDAGLMRRLEAMRDELLDPDAAQREAAVAEREKKRPPRHARELFRYLRSALAE